MRVNKKRVVDTYIGTVRVFMMSSAILLITTSQSGGGIGVEVVMFVLEMLAVNSQNNYNNNLLL